MYQTCKDIIEAWRKDGEPLKSGLERFAHDVGVSENTAKQMRWRDSIGAGYWPRVVSGAQKRGIDGVTLELLATLRAAKFKRLRRERARAARPKPCVPRKEATAAVA